MVAQQTLWLAGTRIQARTDDEFKGQFGTIVKTKSTQYVNVYLVRLDDDEHDRVFTETELDRVQ